MSTPSGRWTRGGRFGGLVGLAVLLGGACLSGCATSRDNPVTMFKGSETSIIVASLESAVDEQQLALDAINEAFTLMDRPPDAGTKMNGADWAERSRRLVRRAETRVRSSQLMAQRADVRSEDVLSHLRSIVRATSDSELRKANQARLDRHRQVTEPAVKALKAANESFEPALIALRDRAAFDQVHAGGGGVGGIATRPDTSVKEAPMLEAMRQAAATAMLRVRDVQKALGDGR